MVKRVFIIHGWDGYPEEGWFPWLKAELEKNGFRALVPSMPDPQHPVIDAWVNKLSDLVGNPDENTYFVGHSIGCQTILRYLEGLPEGQKIGGAVFVGGWFNLMNLSEADQVIAKPWLETPINFEKVKSHTNNFLAIFSDNDRVVPLDNKDKFASELGAEIVIEHNKGHFRGSDGITKLSPALEYLLEVSS